MEAFDYQELSTENGHKDLIVRLGNGEKYVGSFYTFQEIDDIRKRKNDEGEVTNFNFFCSSNMVIVDELSEEVIEGTIAQLLENDGFYTTFFPANKEAVNQFMKQVS
ncbi:MAG: hypothetical protein OEX02_02580 [Cyclobacteriaceae bacterium]|nr:hypothetical protein [Cyclobacteriaceae bacterium]